MLLITVSLVFRNIYLQYTAIIFREMSREFISEGPPPTTGVGEQKPLVLFFGSNMVVSGKLPRENMGTSTTKLIYKWRFAGEIFELTGGLFRQLIAVSASE